MLTSLDLPNSLSFLIFEMAWKSTVILGSIILVSRLLRRQSASLRQVVLSTGVIVMLVAMAAAPALPRWAVPAPHWLPVSTSDKPASVLAAGLMSSDSNAPEVSSTPGGRSLPTFGDRVLPISFTNLLSSIIPLIWLGGTLIVFGRLWMRLHDLRHLPQMSNVLSDEGSRSLVRDAASEGGWIASIVAARLPDLGSITLEACPAVGYVDEVMFEVEGILR